MLTAPEFEHAIQCVENQADIGGIMGSYLPQKKYLMTNQVESFFPCLPKADAQTNKDG
jgi:hypothetical protein